MFRKMTAAIAALALAITGLGAAPAHADNQDLARALAGIAALAVIGAAINDRNKARAQGHVVTRRAAPRHVHPQQVQPRHIQRRHAHPKPRALPHHVARRTLPARCFRAFDTPRGVVRQFGQRCLERHYNRAHRLPQACAQGINTYRGPRYGYNPRCLRDYGYRMARN